jgi:hypothetical protein
MSIQPSAGRDLWIVERRDESGNLDFRGEQPPTRLLRISLDGLYVEMFREEPEAVGDWDTLRSWIKRKGWSMRRVAW